MQGPRAIEGLAHTKAHASTHGTTPTSGVSDCMPSGKTAVKSSVGAKRQVAENMVFSLTEPNLARFAQKETKALQRPKIAALPVSEVRLVWPNPFEYTKNSAAVGGALRVCKRKLAVEDALKSKGLWEQPLTPRKVFGHEDPLTRPCATNFPGPPSGGK